jgi:prevent-host-death family protein
MITVTLEEAQARLPEFIEKIATGEVVLITRDGLPVGTLTSDLPKGVPIIGRGHGSLIYMAPDFDEPLGDFKEYME